MLSKKNKYKEVFLILGMPLTGRAIRSCTAEIRQHATSIPHAHSSLTTMCAFNQYS